MAKVKKSLLSTQFDEALEKNEQGSGQHTKYGNTSRNGKRKGIVVKDVNVHSKNVLSKIDISDLYLRMVNEPFWRDWRNTYEGIDDRKSHHPRICVMNSQGIHNPFVG